MFIFLPLGGNSFTTPSHYFPPLRLTTQQLPSASLSYVTSFSPLAIFVHFIRFF